MKKILHTTLSLLFCLLTAYPVMADGRMRSIVGWVEKVHIDSIDSTFAAKLDTGATTSSINAEIVKMVKAETDETNDFGKVVFSVSDDEGKTRVLERKVQRWVRIKKKNGGFIRRPVVKMRICVGNSSVVGEVNLADRTGFIYPLLVGRNMLRLGNLVVDSTQTFTSKPVCIDTP
jgi:hypothetical protein